MLKLGGLSSRKAASAKKVSPPTVPECNSSASSTCSSHRHSGSSLSSGVYSATSDQRASYCSAEEPPASPTRESVSDHGSISEGSVASSITSNRMPPGVTSSPSHFANPFTFPPPPAGHQGPQFAHLMCKASPGSPHHVPAENPYTYIQRTPLEDQGIDVQSPGRSSPGSGSGSSSGSSGCRNSTTSLDSGRASNSTSTNTQTTHRLSGTSYDSNSYMRHSYHSSSSSIGSMEPESTASVTVHELMKNGVPDAEILRNWLSDLHFEEYYENFISAGYDMPTISRMTPEDLNAIGITKPVHRKKIKAEINRLNIYDGLPDYIPSRLEEWLKLLHLDEYTSSLRNQNYNNVEQFTQITWEDLEDVGIKKLGHQKKVMLAIKRAKDIMSGKHFPRTTVGKLPLVQELRRPDPGGWNNYLHPQQIPPRYPSSFQGPTQGIHYRPDVLTVHIRPNVRSQNNNHAQNEPIYSTFMPDHRRSLRFVPPFRPTVTNRSLDDGDITPTNDSKPFYEGGGGTLPRPNRLATKQRPVAKVTAKTRVDVHEPPKEDSELKKPAQNAPLTVKAAPPPVKQSDIPAKNPGTPKSTPKKLPPPPPRRSNSISECTKNINKPAFPYQRGFSQGYIQSSIQPEISPNLPPPPPAPQDKGNHTQLPEFPPPPPPLTCLNMANAARSSAHHDVDQQNPYRPQRNESNSSIRSTSSSESGESLPFANDNAGTIKSRMNRSAFLLERNSPRSSPLSSPALRRKEGVVLPTIRQPVFIQNDVVKNNTNPKDRSSPEQTNDVLNDIGNMLTNLTNELDAMIEQDRSMKS